VKLSHNKFHIFILHLITFVKEVVHCVRYYRVIHKSVKHFKNSQQINFSTYHGSSYAERERERETLQFFLHISQMLSVSTFGNTADIFAIIHLVPHACQHITVDQSSGDDGCEDPGD